MGKSGLSWKACFNSFLLSYTNALFLLKAPHFKSDTTWVCCQCVSSSTLLVFCPQGKGPISLSQLVFAGLQCLQCPVQWQAEKRIWDLSETGTIPWSSELCRWKWALEHSFFSFVNVKLICFCFTNKLPSAAAWNLNLGIIELDIEYISHSFKRNTHVDLKQSKMY